MRLALIKNHKTRFVRIRHLAANGFSGKRAAYPRPHAFNNTLVTNSPESLVFSGFCIYYAKMKIPPAVQMTAGGMLIFLIISKKRRHVKRQTPDAVFLHHIFKIGLQSGRSAPSGPFFYVQRQNVNAGVFFCVSLQPGEQEPKQRFPP